jgi:hypothetical protein
MFNISSFKHVAARITMSKLLEGITIETFSEIVQQGQIQPGQRFSIMLDEERTAQPKLAEIAAKMRATAAAQGMTTEIFDDIIAGNECGQS